MSSPRRTHTDLPSRPYDVAPREELPDDYFGSARYDADIRAVVRRLANDAEFQCRFPQVKR